MARLLSQRGGGYRVGPTSDKERSIIRTSPPLSRKVGKNLPKQEAEAVKLEIETRAQKAR